MPLYQADDNLVVLHFGFGDVGAASGANDEGVGVLRFHPLNEGEVGRDALSEFTLNSPRLPLALAFENTHSVDVVMGWLRVLKVQMEKRHEEVSCKAFVEACGVLGNSTPETI